MGSPEEIRHFEQPPEVSHEGLAEVLSWYSDLGRAITREERAGHRASPENSLNINRLKDRRRLLGRILVTVFPETNFPELHADTDQDSA